MLLHTRALPGSTSPFVTAVTSRPRPIFTPLVVHAKLTQRQKNERLELQVRKSPHGTPVVDWLLESSPYSKFLQPADIEDLRGKERNLTHIEDIAEKLRRLRIAIANKNRQPWNAGKKHSPDTIKKIRESVSKTVHDPAAIQERKRRVAEWYKNQPQRAQEAKAKALEALRSRWGVQLHKRSWRREVSWFKKPKTKKALVVRTRKRSLTEEELEERRERTRQRKSQAQKELWKNPEYRSRQLKSMRAAVAQAPRRKRSLEQLEKARQRTIHQLSQAQQLVPQLENVVEKLQREEGAAGSSLAMERELREALRSTQATLDKARCSLQSLQAEQASLDAAIDQAIADRAATDGKAAHDRTGQAGSSSATDVGSTPPTPAPSHETSDIAQKEAAWPTAEMVKGSEAAWQSGAGDVESPTTGEQDESTPPPPQQQHSQNPQDHSDAPVYSRQHSLNGSQPLHRGWQGSLSPHSPLQVNVRNGAGRQFVASDTEAVPDSSPDAPAQQNAPSEGNTPPDADMVGVRVRGASDQGPGAVKRMPPGDRHSGVHDSDAENSLPASDELNSQGLHGNSCMDVNGARVVDGNGAVNGCSVSMSSEQLQSQPFDVGSNGHVVHEDGSAAEEEQPASARASAGASSDLATADTRPAALDVGSDEDEESWLKKRKHRLPWQ